MTKKDLRKYTVIQDCINGIYTVPQAANLLKLSDRQVQRLKKEVIFNGPKGIIHKNRGKKSNHALYQDKINKIVELKKTYKYLILVYILICVKMALKHLANIKK